MNDFGRPIDIIKANKFAFFRVVLAVAVLAGAMVYGHYSGNLTLSGTGLVIAVAIAAGLLFLMVRSTIMVMKHRVELYETGMLVHDRTGAKAIAYSDIDAVVLEKHVQRYQGIIPTGSFNIYLFLDKEGNTLVKLYSQHLARLAEKMDALEARLRNSGAQCWETRETEY